MADKEKTSTSLVERMKADPGVTAAVLMAVYANQTSDEAVTATTIHKNGVGFNASDAAICCDMARFYLRKGWLSTKQHEFLARVLPKYIGQVDSSLLTLPIKPCSAFSTPVVTSTTAPPRQEKIVSDYSDLVARVSFPYDAQMVVNVKTLTGRRWVAERKCWAVPYSRDAMAKLEEWGFVFEGRVAEWWAFTKSRPAVSGLEEADVRIKKTLYPFQKKGVSFLNSRNGRGLIADEMGLGKTVQAIAWLQYNERVAVPAVVVCPASVKLNWKREFNDCLPGWSVRVLSGTQIIDDEVSYPAAVYIINYDILVAWVDWLLSKGIQAVVWDEAHYAKNSKAARTAALRKLVDKIPYRVALTGTPIVNRPVEFLTTIQMIDPTLFPSSWKYLSEFCGAHQTRFGWNFAGATNTEKLHAILTSSIMLRRLKKDVLTELPPKVRTVIPLELSNAKHYNRVEADFIEWVKETKGVQAAKKAKGAEALTKIEALKQIALQGKIQSAIEWIRDYIDADGKLVVFAIHTDTIDAVMRAFSEIAVKIDGRDSIEKRQVAVDRFQNDPSIRLFVGNIKAAGVGITLTAASATCFLELGWTPGDHDQAEDRVHRIGQTADSVQAYYLLAGKTIEEEIARLIDSKRMVLANVLDGQEAEEAGMISQLLERVAC